MSSKSTLPRRSVKPQRTRHTPRRPGRFGQGVIPIHGFSSFYEPTAIERDWYAWQDAARGDHDASDRPPYLDHDIPVEPGDDEVNPWDDDRTDPGTDDSTIDLLGLPPSADDEEDHDDRTPDRKAVWPRVGTVEEAEFGPRLPVLSGGCEGVTRAATDEDWREYGWARAAQDMIDEIRREEDGRNPVWGYE